MTALTITSLTFFFWCHLYLYLLHGKDNTVVITKLSTTKRGNIPQLSKFNSKDTKKNLESTIEFIET